MSDIDWSKAPAHATHWCPGNARIEEGWIYKAGQEFYSCYAEKSCEHIPSFPAWRALRLIPMPVEPDPWSGKGLPPVGTVCELSFKGMDQGVVTVMYISDEFCVCRNHKYGNEQGAVTENYFFRPIRTPEQIAAEDRDKAISQMEFDTDCLDRGAFTKLYDAGWRKVNHEQQ